MQFIAVLVICFMYGIFGFFLGQDGMVAAPKAPPFHVKTGESKTGVIEVKDSLGQTFYVFQNSESKLVWVKRKDVDK